MRWWHWLIIAGATFGLGLLIGGVALAGGTSAALAALAASMMRGRADRGLEFADELTRRTQAEDMRRREDDRRIRAAGAAAAAKVAASPALPIAPPQSRHLGGES